MSAPQTSAARPQYARPHYAKPHFARPRWLAVPDLAALDLAAVALAAFEGATIGRDAGLRTPGILFAGFATGLLGGILRDLLLGHLAPATLRTVRYPSVALAGAAVVCLPGDGLRAVPGPLISLLDAGGLALFCVGGALAALAARVGTVAATMLGALSAVGGGAVRDLSLGQVPSMLGINLYVAAVGAAVTVGCARFGRSRRQAVAAGVTAAVALRLLALWQHWGLPIPHA